MEPTIATRIIHLSPDVLQNWNPRLRTATTGEQIVFHANTGSSICKHSYVSSARLPLRKHTPSTHSNNPGKTLPTLFSFHRHNARHNFTVFYPRHPKNKAGSVFQPGVVATVIRLVIYWDSRPYPPRSRLSLNFTAEIYMEWNQDVTLPEIHLYNHDCNTAPVAYCWNPTSRLYHLGYRCSHVTPTLPTSRYTDYQPNSFLRHVTTVSIYMFSTTDTGNYIPTLLHVLADIVYRRDTKVVHYTTAHVFHRRHITLQYITLLFHHRLPGQQSTAIFQIISAS